MTYIGHSYVYILTNDKKFMTQIKQNDNVSLPLCHSFPCEKKKKEKKNSNVSLNKSNSILIRFDGY